MGHQKRGIKHKEQGVCVHTRSVGRGWVTEQLHIATNWLCHANMTQKGWNVGVHALVSYILIASSNKRHSLPYSTGRMPITLAFNRCSSRMLSI